MQSPMAPFPLTYHLAVEVTAPGPFIVRWFGPTVMKATTGKKLQS